jgi:hypothetical protein
MKQRVVLAVLVLILAAYVTVSCDKLKPPLPPLPTTDVTVPAQQAPAPTKQEPGASAVR